MAERQYPFGMTNAQQDRFGLLADRLRSLGFWVSSAPLEGREDDWLNGIERNLAHIKEKLADVQRAFRCRGLSEAARYYLHTSPSFDPGFGISITQEQREATLRYQRKLDRGVARFDAAFGDSDHGGAA